MLQAYTANGSAFDLASVGEADPLPKSVVWIDMISPSADEERRMEAMLGVELPTHDDLKDIEPSSRLYIENGTTYMTASLVWRVEAGYADIAEVGFVVAGDRLVTIRYAEPKAFRLYSSSAQRLGGCGTNGFAVLTKLLEAIIDRTAEILEITSARLDQMSINIFQRDVAKTHKKNEISRDLEGHISEIAQYQRVTAKTRESLMSLARLLSFLSAIPAIDKEKELRERSKSVSRDIASLSEHVGFISANITFHLDATLGLINLEQNKIIKIFSIASVVLLPPAVLAGIYGMNFHDMPELSWEYGYIYALSLMVIVSVGPILWFRKKGWL